MNRKWWNTMIGLLWLVLPAVALRYWLVWDRLPTYMATHFDAAGRPNGWMSRQVSLEFALGITAFLLVIFTLVLYFAHRQHTADRFSWALLGFFYLVVGFLYSVNSGIVEHNLTGRPVLVTPVLILLPVAILALMAIYLRTKRGEPLPASAPIAEEIHASRWWALVFLVPLVLEFWMFVTVPLAGARLAATLLSLLFAACAAFAWSGFQYRFTQAGLEIYTLGFRLRSIPRAQIHDYTVEGWSPLRGYGIRGVGGCRAYVWSNRVVHIKTNDGDVFLGHSEPERIVHDLDAIKGFAH
jgi:hypothetical protein